MVRGLEPLCYGAGLGELGLLSLGRRRLRGDLRAAPSTYRGRQEAGEGLCTWARGDRPRGNGLKLGEGRCR